MYVHIADAKAQNGAENVRRAARELHGRATYIFGTGSKDEIGYRFSRQFECQIA